MTKEEWTEIYNIFEKAFIDFQMEYATSKNEKNQEVRKASERRVKNSIEIVRSWVNAHPELWEIITGKGVNINEKVFFYDEFFKPIYFQKDMPKYLKRIKEHINKL